jgi:uncharacterized OsmC-like protein
LAKPWNATGTRKTVVNAPRPNPRAAGENLLQASQLPLFFEVADFNEHAGAGLADRHGQSVRVWARSLTVMQKEAIVYAARSGRAWRLASDEGPYLMGHDFGPPPLSFLSTGMVASFHDEITALARRRDITIDDLELVQNNRYMMEGSALNGTMTGSALPVDLEARIACAPLDRMLRSALVSRFRLFRNGRHIDAGTARPLEAPQLPAPRTLFESLQLTPPVADPGWIRKLENVDKGTPGFGASLKAEQKRIVRLQVTCRQREDGVKVIRQEMPNPPGSTFQFLSDEPEDAGGQGRAPDPASYVSAGIAFCFMTQLGRYAKIVRKNLDAYDVVQDTHFSPGAASGGARMVLADPVETHVYLESSEDDDFARTCLNMGEQTCYLHALCRTELSTRIQVSRTG